MDEKRVRDLILSEEEIFLRQCVVQNTQGSGPGGQKKNRIRSGVRIQLSGTELMTTACEFRETLRNKHSALQKLRLTLALSIFLNDDLGNMASTPLTDSEKEPFLENFRDKINPMHPHFPLCVYLALRLLIEMGTDLKKTSTLLGLSPSRLVKFLGRDKKTLQTAQRVRNFFGKTPLKF